MTRNGKAILKRLQEIDSSAKWLWADYPPGIVLSGSNSLKKRGLRVRGNVEGITGNGAVTDPMDDSVNLLEIGGLLGIYSGNSYHRIWVLRFQPHFDVFFKAFIKTIQRYELQK